MPGAVVIGGRRTTEPGKYADLLVLDRGYFTVPAAYKDVRPVMTIVGGRMIVYKAK